MIVGNEKKPYSLAVPLLGLIISLGPVGWTVLDILSERYDRLLFLFILSIILTIYDTICWCCYFSKDNTFDTEENE